MTQPDPVNGPPQQALTFSLEGLPLRDELLFKSLVRLIKHLTAHTWMYQAQPADLRVVAEGVLSRNLQATSGAQQQALVLGSLPSRRPNYLCMPIRAAELLDELNRLGTLVVAARAAQADSAVDWDTAGPTRLLRWPPAQLVATPQRMRLATLLTGKPATLAQLQARSSQSLDACRAFLNDLSRANLLEVQPSSGTAPATTLATARTPGTGQAAAPTGLLARIRNRLSLLSLGKS